MSPVWYAPYLSAAENIKWGGEFLIDLEEVSAFKELSEGDRYQYRFHEKTGLQNYNHNPIGFAYFIAAAKRLFFWLPDLAALEAFQILLHVIISLWAVELLQGPTRKLLFVLLYALNPLVIYYVTYPYYYFYQVLPSFGLAVLLLFVASKKELAGVKTNIFFISMAALLGLVVLTRPTTIAAGLAFFLLAAALLQNKLIAAIGALVFGLVIITGYGSNEKNLWHTAYIGVGAYENGYMEGLSDNNGYSLFERKTGETLDASLGGNYYDDAVIQRYKEISRAEYVRILQADWLRLIRNAVLNVGLGYTVGYIVGAGEWMHYFFAVLGYAFLVLLLVSGQYVLAVLIGAASMTFALYFPPIPAYMYGSYLLIVLGAIGILDFFGVVKRLDARFATSRLLVGGAR